MTLLDAIVSTDRAVALALNAYAAAPTGYNRILVVLSGANFIKMGPFVFMVVWYWNRPPFTERRRVLINGLTGIFIAFFLGRILQVTLPHRARPIQDATLGMILPPGMSEDILGGWSSFPSDHAAIFAAMVVLAFALSRWVGFAAFLWVAVVVLAERAYLGLHFFSDILAGLALGVIAGLIALRTPVVRWVGPMMERLSVRQPALFYAGAILFLDQLSEMFTDIRMYTSILKGILQGTF